MERETKRRERSPPLLSHPLLGPHPPSLSPPQMGRLFSLFLFISLLFSQRLDSVNGGNPSYSPLTQIPRDLYHSSEALLKEVQDLVGRHNDKLTMETMRAGNKGYIAEVVVITYNHVKKQTSDNQKFRILLSFGQHGREVITSEVALHLLYALAGEQRIVGVRPISVNSMLDNLVIKVVPMENSNGRKLVEAGDLCERRNGRGVDLNRNWSVDWGKKEKDYDPSEENPGLAPFSEPEAQIMRRLSKSFNPHIWVNVHSGMEALFMPYDHKNATPDGLMSQLMKSMLEDVNRRHFEGRCLVGHGGGSVGYLAHGTTTDYMHDVAKTPMSFTFEIYGDEAASVKDCFKMFNPVDAISFKRVVSNWCSAFFMIFEAGPHRLAKAPKAISKEGKWVSIDGDVGDSSSTGGKREGMKLEGLELGIQELRTYFRLFMLSSVLLMFMFCSRISKSKLQSITASV